MDNLWKVDEKELPLEHIIEDGGFCGIFRRIGCVGDSLSSGEYEIHEEDGTKHFYDLYEYSWGQFIAYQTGSKVYNFSRGGMTAKWYNESYAEEQGFWEQEKACQAYIIALGVNDLYGQKQEIGKITDICVENWKENRDTFAGEYGKIIQRLKEIQPDAKFFLVTMPRTSSEIAKDDPGDAHALLLKEMTKIFENTYVIDLRTYGPVYDAEFKKTFYHNSHMTACGYLFTAKIIMSYIDYLIRHHMEEFKLAGMIGFRK